MNFPKRGEIWWTDFDPARGAEIKKKRPACVISNNINNEFGALVTVLPISDAGKKVYPFEVAVSKSEAGLQKDSKLKCQQIRSVDKMRLLNKIGDLPKEKIRSVEKALAIHLGIIFKG